MESRLQRHVAILGGSAGIGLAAARLAAERGAKVTLGGRDQGRLDAAAVAVPRLSHVDELWRERPDGKTEFVVRFWYRAKS
jgi:NAD(P)-dependent dehydrogenase (short-subunit alcohol dehydrogenase family)